MSQTSFYNNICPSKHREKLPNSSFQVFTDRNNSAILASVMAGPFIDINGTSFHGDTLHTTADVLNKHLGFAEPWSEDPEITKVQRQWCLEVALWHPNMLPLALDHGNLLQQKASFHRSSDASAGSYTGVMAKTMSVYDWKEYREVDEHDTIEYHIGYIADTPSVISIIQTAHSLFNFFNDTKVGGVNRPMPHERDLELVSEHRFNVTEIGNTWINDDKIA